ncbi:MAG: hypothetical protein RL090_498 [Bacteroidota bacterium]|jgi:hypothetical protein
MKTNYIKINQTTTWIFSALLIAFTACGSGTKDDSNSNTKDTVIAKADTVVEAVTTRETHPYFNSIMNFISGRSGSDISFPIDTAYFNKYSSELAENMKKIEDNRLFKVRDWYSNVLKSNSRNDSLPVFYPFSGGDFLHIHYMYPNANEYVMMAIEPVGYFPDMDSMSVEDKTKLLGDVNYNMRDIFNKSYFITKNMHSDLRSRKLITGMILPIVWGIGVTGHEILDIQDASFDSAGKVMLKPITERDHNFTKGVQITFRKKGTSQEKTVTYFSVDISDKGFASETALVKYLDSKEPYNSFLKAASYLPHYRSFSGIRNNLLAKTVNHVQDDTGIPYKYFTPETFTAKVFGYYTKPVADFNENLFQKDLASAYRDSTIFGGRLDFSMGYHWASSEQNEMVFMRK